VKALIVLALVPWTLAAQGMTAGDTTPRPISLAEAVQLAQRNAPQAVQARGQVRTTSSAQRSAFGAFLPTLSLSASNSKRQGDQLGPQGTILPFTGAPWSYTNGLSASMNLFDGGKRWFDLSRTRSDELSAESNEVLQRYVVALSVKQQYFAVLAARESEGAAQAQMEQAQEQMKASTARMHAGAATKSDSLRSVIQLGNAQLAVLTARSNAVVANAALTRLVGTPFTVTASSADSSLSTNVSLDSAALEQYAEQGPAVRQAEAQLTSARASLRSAHSPYLPSLDLSYGKNGTATDSTFQVLANRYAYSSSLRLSLSYTLFNGFSREQQVVSAQVAQDNADAGLRDARLGAQQTLVQNLSALRNAQQRIEIQLASVAAAEEDLRVQQQRYALGASVQLDVLTSQTTLNQARSALIQARYDYRIAKAQIEALIGRDL
jgi:outer membrane protein